MNLKIINQLKLLIIYVIIKLFIKNLCLKHVLKFMRENKFKKYRINLN